ncbi:MAG TPA: ATP-binding protein [Vicinamibacteria bacterium]
MSPLAPPLASSETAALLDATDWAQTPLGPVEQWPQSLKLAVGICLNSRFPMFVWWGEQLVNIYNDAYVPILGQRHPRAFGRPARESWEEIWPVVGPQAEAVMTRGEATWNERVLLVMERHGYTEETYFTWSYSPIVDERGRIGGLFCACKEETATVQAERERDLLLKQLEAERARLATAFAQSPAFLAVLNGPDHVFEFVNERYLNLVGRRDVVGKPAREALPELEGQGFFELLDRVYTTGEPYVGTDTRVLIRRTPEEGLEETYLDFVYQPMRRPDGGTAGILAHGVDVTEKKRGETALRQSEARFRELADAMPQIVFTATPEGEVDYFNQRWSEYTGLPVGAVDFESWRDVHTEEGLRRVMEAWPQALRTGQPYEIEYLLRRYDGMFRWHLGRALPIRDEQGRIVRWFGTNTDIHALKNFERSLERSESRFRLLSDALAAEKRVLERIAVGAPVSEVLEVIARATEAQSTDGMLCSILVLDDSGERLLHGAAPSLPAAYNEAIHGVAIGPSVGSCGTAAFQRRPVYVTDVARDPLWEGFHDLAATHGLGACCSTPVMASDGTVLGTVAMYYTRPHEPSARDRELTRSATHLAGIVLEKDRMDRRLRHSLEAEQAARAEVERASRMKDEFLATLSHELRTPLNAVLGWTRILSLKPDVPPDLLQGIGVIERNARAQATIIQDLLDMSAIVSGKVRLSVERLDLATVVQAAVDTAAPAAQARQIAIELVLDAPGEVAVNGDASRLQQVFWNLLSNAVKFTPRDGRIQVRLARSGAEAEVRVTDTGAGIPPEFLPHVFDRFRQADASTTRRFGGLGLGLSIVKQLVELHGGAVTAESEGVGRGAAFVVTLPLAVGVAAAAEPASGARRARAEAAGGADEAVNLAGVRVLVVDDDPDAREMVQRLLVERHAVVSTAGSSEDALRQFRDGRFDVLISDIGMPGEDGLTLIRRVRALGPEAGGDVPAVALTAYARPEDRAKAMSAGYTRHAAKPIEPARLFAVIASVTAGR